MKRYDSMDFVEYILLGLLGAVCKTEAGAIKFCQVLFT